MRRFVPNSTMTACLAWAAIVCAQFLAQGAAAAERYFALFANGDRVESESLPFWPLPSGNGKWAGRELFAAGKIPLQLVRDREISTSLRPPYLVLANGDILNGTPVQLETSAGGYGEPLRIRVQLESPLSPVSGTSIAVRTDRIARIVGAEATTSASELAPGTVVLADGRRLAGRSVRWRESGLAVLTAQGIVDVSFEQIGDIAIPGIDAIAAVLDDHALTNHDEASIVRYSLVNGSILTTSRATRTEQRTRTRGKMISETYHVLQPAWTSQPIKFSEGEIAWCGYRAASEVPLSLLPAETIANRRLIGSAEPWQRNRTADGAILASGPREADLGISAHSHSELTFELPEGSTELSTCVGLDVAVQYGGCVRCKIYAEADSAESSGKLLWDSGIHRGSDQPKATGPLKVQGLKRVRLVTEFAHEGRPAGADPLDIRDQVCWLAPLVKMDISGSRRTKMLLAALTGAQDWELLSASARQPGLDFRWNEENERWDPLLTLRRGAEMRLTRKLRIGPACDVLELRTAAPTNLKEHSFELQVNRSPVAHRPSADSDEIDEINKRLSNARRKRDSGKNKIVLPPNALAYWWDLQRWQGQEVTLTITIRGVAEKNEVDWRGLSCRSAIDNLPEDGKALVPAVPLTALKGTAAGAPRYREPVKNALPPGKKPQPIRFLGQHFENGYGMSRGTKLSFPLEARYKRFVAVVGCCELTGGRLRVLVDDKVIWETGLIDSLSPAQQIDLELPSGGKRLTLEVSGDGSYSGAIGWANAGFVLE